MTATTSPATAPPAGDLADLNEIRALVRAHGVDWRVEWDRAVKRAGQAAHVAQRLTFSRHLWPYLTPAQRRETVLHEVAHALAGPRVGHGPRWRAIHRRLGGTAQRTIAIDVPTEQRRPKYIGTCPAGHTHERMRRTTLMNREVSCVTCCPTFNRNHLITWRQMY